MPPDKLPEELPFKWRQLATPIGLGSSDFAQLVLENDLRVVELGGWRYAANKTQDGYDLYRSSNWYLYQARRVNTQTNVAGGTLTTRISMNAGQIGKLVSMELVNPASAGCDLFIQVQDEDSAESNMLGYSAAGASRVCRLPSTGTAATASSNYVDSREFVLGPGEFLVCKASAALQTETQTVAVVLLLSTPDIPVWDTTGSAGTPSLAASTISAANTMQLVAVP